MLFFVNKSVMLMFAVGLLIIALDSFVLLSARDPPPPIKVALEFRVCTEDLVVPVNTNTRLSIFAYSFLKEVCFPF